MLTPITNKQGMLLFYLPKPVKIMSLPRSTSCLKMTGRSGSWTHRKPVMTMNFMEMNTMTLSKLFT